MTSSSSLSHVTPEELDRNEQFSDASGWGGYILLGGCCRENDGGLGNYHFTTVSQAASCRLLCNLHEECLGLEVSNMPGAVSSQKNEPINLQCKIYTSFMPVAYGSEKGCHCLRRKENWTDEETTQITASLSQSTEEDEAAELRQNQPVSHPGLSDADVVFLTVPILLLVLLIVIVCVIVVRNNSKERAYDLDEEEAQAADSRSKMEDDSWRDAEIVLNDATPPGHSQSQRSKDKLQKFSKSKDKENSGTHPKLTRGPSYWWDRTT